MFHNYDAYWLSDYYSAIAFLTEHQPAKLVEFEKAIAIFKVNQEFKEVLIPDFFDHRLLNDALAVAHSLSLDDLEDHELFEFGRHVRHNHPFFTSLQAALTEKVSDYVGETVEPCYNFLSFYNDLGICEPHMDAPVAKWTVDICLEQSGPWGLFVSGVEAWPDANAINSGYDTQAIKAEFDFSEYTLRPGDGVIFGGSSQWHYRNKIPRVHEKNFCTLIFLHYIPAGTAELVEPKNWPALLGVPELGDHLDLRRSI